MTKTERSCVIYSVADFFKKFMKVKQEGRLINKEKFTYILNCSHDMSWEYSLR